MPRLPIRLLACCLLSCLAAAQSPQRWTDRSNLGFQGLVHTERLYSQQLASDPRRDPVLSYESPAAQSLVFDLNGWIIEQASYTNADGQLGPVVRLTRDSEGNELESVQDDPAGPVRYRHEVRKGPCGKREELTWLNDRLDARAVTEYDPDCNPIVSTVYGRDGKLLARSTSSFDEKDRMTEWKNVGPGNKVYSHHRRRFDDRGDLVTNEDFDAAGKLIRSLALREGRLTSWWQDPECRCSGNIGFNFENDRTVTYYFQPDGSLHTGVQTHKGRYGNVEPDEMTLHDASGQLLEKVTIEYERDRFGNWTSRRVFVLDLATGSLVPVRRDTRVLTYY